MALPEIIEGTGKELQRHLDQHPTDGYWLIRLTNGMVLNGLNMSALGGTISLEEEARLFDELAEVGKHLSSSLAGETYSRETIYVDQD